MATTISVSGSDRRIPEVEEGDGAAGGLQTERGVVVASVTEPRLNS